RSANALQRASRRLAEWLRANTETSLADVAYTLQAGRRRFRFRRTGLCRRHAEAAALLADESSEVFEAASEDPCAGDPAAIAMEGDHASLRAIARSWEMGADIDWSTVHGAPRSRVPLPTYPFEHARYWIEARSLATPRTQVGTDDSRRRSLAPRPPLP